MSKASTRQYRGERVDFPQYIVHCEIDFATHESGKKAFGPDCIRPA